MSEWDRDSLVLLFMEVVWYQRLSEWKKGVDWIPSPIMIYILLDRLCNYRCALLMIARLDDKLSNQSHTEWLSGNISNLKVGDASSSPPESIDFHKIPGVHGWWVSSRMKDRSMVSCRPLPTTRHENIVDTMSIHLEYWLLYNSNNKIQFSSTSN